MKKFYFILFIIIVLIFGIYLKYSKKESGNEVVFWTLQMSDFSTYINGVISDFEKENPNIKIKWVDIPFSEGEKRTLASVLSDNPADLVNLNPDFSSILAQKGTLYEIPKSELYQFHEGILEFLEQNEKYYSIPWYATSAITFYNKDLLKSSGITLPQNYSQVVDFSSIVKNKSKSYIIQPNITENDTMLKILNKYGVASKELINSEKSVEIFEMFKYMYEHGYIPKETVTTTLQESLEKYMSENVVIINAGANFLNTIKENAPSTYQKTDVAPQITGEYGQYDFSLMNFVIPKRAKHRQEALKFALYLTNDKNQLELAKLTNIIAVNKNTLNDEFYTKYESNDLLSKARILSAKQLNKVKPAFKSGKNQKEINNIINTATQEILLNKTDTKTILDRVAKKWKELEE